MTLFANEKSFISLDTVSISIALYKQMKLFNREVKVDSEYTCTHSDAAIHLITEWFSRLNMGYGNNGVCIGMEGAGAKIISQNFPPVNYIKSKHQSSANNTKTTNPFNGRLSNIVKILSQKNKDLNLFIFLLIKMSIILKYIVIL